MTPEAALLRVIHCLDRAHETGFKTKAFVRALDVVRNTPVDELERRVHDETLTEMEGIGTSTARVITDAILDRPSEYLAKIEAESVVQISDAGRVYLDALRGDCHCHSTWSARAPNLPSRSCRLRRIHTNPSFGGGRDEW